MNKIEKFAIAMSVLLYEMRAESDLSGASLTTPNTNSAVPHEFIESTIDDVEHIENMKEIIYKDIVQTLTEHPNLYKNDKGEYEYNMDVYGFAYVIDSYVERLYEDTNETKSVWVCPDCRSDNVQFKTWTDANTMTATNDECPMEEGDCHCKDCESTSVLITKIMMPRKKVIGFQVILIDGVGHPILHPKMNGNHSNVYNLEQANKMVSNPEYGEYCELKTIWTDDIECPVMMFEGNVRE